MKMRKNVLTVLLLMFSFFMLTTSHCFAKEEEIKYIDLDFQKQTNKYVDELEVTQRYDKDLYYIYNVIHDVEGRYDTITIILKPYSRNYFTKNTEYYFCGEEVECLEYKVTSNRVKIVVEYELTEGKLKTPTNLSHSNGIISWSKVDYADYYFIEVKNGSYYDYTYVETNSLKDNGFLRKGKNVVTVVACSDDKNVEKSKEAAITIYYNKNEEVSVNSKNENWVKKGNKWYYKMGSKYATKWQTIDGNYYYFNTSGEMLTGEQQISGSTHLFKSTGELVLGWRYENGYWYYHSINGMLKSMYCNIDTQEYYFDAAGRMALGPTTINGKNYMFRTVAKTSPSTGITYEVGSMLQNEWYQDYEGYWYFYGTYGVQKTGWHTEVDGKTYYLDPNNKGRMVVGQKTILGKTYTFNQSGELIQ